MDWKSVKLPSGAKLFKAHHFNYFHNGVNFVLAVDEYVDGSFTGHGEDSSDHNFVIESVSAKDIGECLNLLIQRIQARAK